MRISYHELEDSHYNFQKDISYPSISKDNTLKYSMIVQVKTSTESIWKGSMWTKVYLDIELSKNLRQDLLKQVSSIISPLERPPTVLNVDFFFDIKMIGTQSNLQIPGVKREDYKGSFPEYLQDHGKDHNERKSIEKSKKDFSKSDDPSNSMDFVMDLHNNEHSYDDISSHKKSFLLQAPVFQWCIETDAQEFKSSNTSIKTKNIHLECQKRLGTKYPFTFSTFCCYISQDAIMKENDFVCFDVFLKANIVSESNFDIQNSKGTYGLSIMECYASSKKIRIAEYAFTMEEQFFTNPYVSQMDEFLNASKFIWYSKCGGENAGLDITIHMKNSKGHEKNSCSFPLPIKVDLVYNDGSPTPFMPLSPLKERKSTVTSKNPLFRPMRPPPVLEPYVTNHSFSFRIEEVSSHHAEYIGFKLKVSLDYDRLKLMNTNTYAPWIVPFVHPGLLDETIIVRSKPNLDKSAEKMTSLHGGRSLLRRESFLRRLYQNNHQNYPSVLFSEIRRVNSIRKNVVLANRSTPPPRKVSLMSSNSFPTSSSMTSSIANRSQGKFIAITNLKHLVMTHESLCLWCKSHLSLSDPFVIENHASSCYFICEMLPNIMMSPIVKEIYQQNQSSIITPNSDEIQYEQFRVSTNKTSILVHPFAAKKSATKKSMTFYSDILNRDVSDGEASLMCADLAGDNLELSDDGSVEEGSVLLNLFD